MVLLHGTKKRKDLFDIAGDYCLNGKEIHEEINYDILQSNVIARELRLIGYELISLFNGFDNYDKAVIPIIKIDDLKGIESIIK